MRINVYPATVLAGKPEEKCSRGWPGRRWVSNIEMNITETGWNGMNWIRLVQDMNK